MATRQLTRSEEIIAQFGEPLWSVEALNEECDRFLIEHGRRHRTVGGYMFEDLQRRTLYDISFIFIQKLLSTPVDLNIKFQVYARFPDQNFLQISDQVVAQLISVRAST